MRGFDVARARTDEDRQPDAEPGCFRQFDRLPFELQNFARRIGVGKLQHEDAAVIGRDLDVVPLAAQVEVVVVVGDEV